MVFRKKIYSLNVTRYLFTLVGVATAMLLLVISMYINEALHFDLAGKVPISNNEYHIFYNDARFMNTPVDFESALRQEFINVAPIYEETVSVKVNESFEGMMLFVTPETNTIDKLFYDNKIVTIELNNRDSNGVYVSETIYKVLNDKNTIEVNNVTLDIAGYFSSDSEIIGLMINEDAYIDLINIEFRIETNGVVKAPYTRYFFESDYNEDDTILYVRDIYFDPVPDGEFIETHNELLTEYIEDYFPYTDFIRVLMFMVLIVSFLNFVNSINFSINERKKTNKILYTLGMRRIDFYKLFTCEYAIVSFISSIISILLGTVISYYIVVVSLSMSFKLLSIQNYLFVIFITVIVAIVYTLITLMFLRRENLVSNKME